MKEVDVCIISWAKTPELEKVTRKGIETLLVSEENIKFNIFVVESNKSISYDNHPNTKTIYTDLPFGYNRYLNLARSHGKAPFVFLANNDLSYEKNWASNIIFEMEKNPNLLSASPFCPQVQNKINFQASNTYYGYTIRCHLNGWAIFQRREIYEKAPSCIDDSFVFWYADNDYSMSLQKNNISHAVVINSVVNHHEFDLGKTGMTALTNDEIFNLTQGQAKVFQQKWGR